MQKFVGTILGKTIKLPLMFRPNGGHALPGLVVDSLMPSYISKMLANLPDGVVFITGTNGKTTTTKALVEILRAKGKQVLTNSTGSNMARGIASSLIQNSSWLGKLNYDIAVLEVDEASIKPLITKVTPRWVLALNVSRDQLDRFGEVDTIANYMKLAMEAASEGIITNAADPHLVLRAMEVNKQTKTPVYFFGAEAKLLKYFPNDYELAAVKKSTATSDKSSKTSLEVSLHEFSGQQVTYQIDGQEYNAQLKLSGQHNFLNGAAALALAKHLLPGSDPAELVAELAKVNIAFGRGETYLLPNGAKVELVLVKNPASFRQAMAAYGQTENQLMVAINDNIADGRDVSWLWDVDFSPLAGKELAVTSGSRAADMALRLKYDNISVSKIEHSLEKALKLIANPEQTAVVLATYTAMLSLYNLLSKTAEKL